MIEQEVDSSAHAADKDPTQPNSPDLAKPEGDCCLSGTTSTTENAIATAPAIITTNQPGEVDIEALRQTSRHGSILEQLVKVPRAQRRGLFGRLTILAEVEDPKLYPRGVKWFITFVVAIAGMAAPLGSTIMFRKEFLLRMLRTPADHLHVKRRSPKLRLSLKLPQRSPISQSRSFY